MANIGTLHTMSEEHSIKEAVVSFILSPKIAEIGDYRNLVGENGALRNKFQKFESLNIQGVHVSQQLDQTNVCETKERGFKIVSFEDGITRDIIQALPQPQTTVLTYNTVKYVKWNEFKCRVLEAISVVSKINPNINLVGVGVMFIDEFYFDSDSAYQPTLLFNSESKNLPKNILDSDLVDYSLNTHSKKDDYDYIGNISIRVFNQDKQKVIRITGNTMLLLSQQSFENSMCDPLMNSRLDFGHEENKSMLKDILSQETLKMIHL